MVDITQNIFLAQSFTDFGGDLLNVGICGCRIRVKIFQQNNKFITTQAGDGVAFAHAAQQSPRNFDEQQIAGIMAVGVVELLEAVEVKKEDSKSLAVTLRVVQALGQAIEQ